MSAWLIAFLVGVGFAAWAYTKLAKYNGNASPGSNMLIAAIGGSVIALILLSMLNFLFHF